MNIAMVVSLLAPEGGIETALVPLATGLRAAGHDVSLYVLEPPPEPNPNREALERGGIAIRGPSWLERRVDRALLARGGPLAGALSRALGGRALRYRRLGRQLDRRRADVIHVHGWGCGQDPPGALARLAGEPGALVFTEHASPDPRLHPPLSDAPIRFADLLVAVSDAGRAGLVSVGGARQPIRVLRYGVEPVPALARAARADDEIVIACVARLAPQKRHRDLLDAFARVRAARPGVRLLVAGSGPLEAELREQARRLDIEGAVELLGRLDRSELPALFARADLVALASAWEGLPIALIEAMSAGMPLVATDAGGSPELVEHGVNGLVVPVGDVEALAGALLRLADDPELRRSMASASAARFARGEFDPSAAVAGHLEAYRFALELRRARAGG